MAPLFGSCGLRRGEESWCIAFERLQDRFPGVDPERILRSLRDANGHAGRAAAALRTVSSGHSPQRTTFDTDNGVFVLGPASGRSQRTPREEERREPESMGPNWTDLEALNAEGLRLRRELDSLLLGTEKSDHVAGVSVQGSARCQLDFEASRGEARKLKHELEGALEILGTTGAVNVAERDVLCREVESSIATHLVTESEVRHPPDREPPTERRRERVPPQPDEPAPRQDLGPGARCRRESYTGHDRSHRAAEPVHSRARRHHTPPTLRSDLGARHRSDPFGHPSPSFSRKVFVDLRHPHGDVGAFPHTEASVPRQAFGAFAKGHRDSSRSGKTFLSQPPTFWA